MADRQKFEGAMNKWRGLKRDGKLSVPHEEGDVAVLCSYDIRIPKGKLPIVDRLLEERVLRKEAKRIGKFVTKQGRHAELILDFGYDDIKFVLQDPQISDVVVIGHGALPEVFIKDKPLSEVFDWEDVSKHADHLKQGYFIQRHCGGYSRDLSAPLGMFAVSDFSHVHAAPGHVIRPNGPKHPDHSLIVPVFGGDIEPTYTSIKDNFPHSIYANSYPPVLPPPVPSALIR